jgi:vancomycin resistance protein YoaR
MYTPVRQRRSRGEPVLLEQVLLALLIGFLLFGLTVAATFVGSRLWYAGRIFPGVSVNGIDLSGLTPEAAEARLQQQITYPQSGKVVFRDMDKMWVATPGELGLILDTQSTAAVAFQFGRGGLITDQVRAQISAASYGQDLPPIVVIDQRIALNHLEKIAKEINHPTIDAALSLKGLDVVVSPGQVGREVDIENSLKLVSLKLQTMNDTVIDLFARETKPVILDASAEAELARKILAAPLTIDLPGAEAGKEGAPWVLSQEQLAKMITIEKNTTPGGERYQVGLRDDLLRSVLEDIAPKLVRSPVNAHFTFNDSTKSLEVLAPATIGRKLDVDASIQSIQEKLRAGDHTTALTIIYTNPALTDQTSGKDLGIIELVHSETSYFRGSSAARVQNIKAAASKFQGAMVAPGETFSMAATIGDISLDNGFAEALIIVGGQTIKGVGGGVCQVSTTLFRGVFFAGYPIVQRYAHAYRVGYYEQTAAGRNANFAGLDATVFVPIVDFKFKNDTPYWLLMETYVNGYSLTWKFYSTSDGRKVEWDTTGPTNITPPPDPIYRENSDLNQGEIRQVDWAAEGSDVSVSRIVYTKDGSVYFNDTVNTHYQAWQDVYEYGPGTDIPTP